MGGQKPHLPEMLRDEGQEMSGGWKEEQCVWTLFVGGRRQRTAEAYPNVGHG